MTRAASRRARSRIGILAPSGLLLALVACTPVDRDQARLCRIALPVLEAAGTRIAVIRTRAVQGGVRILYRAITPDADLERFAECRFAPGRRMLLEAVTTDRGAIPGARVHLLRRHYVETPEGAAGDPGPATPDADDLDWQRILALLALLLTASCGLGWAYMRRSRLR